MPKAKRLSKTARTKAEATTAMYAKLKAADRETAVAAVMEGAARPKKAR
jgi:hypothetical protein